MPMTDAPNFGTKFGRRRPCLRYIGPQTGTSGAPVGGGLCPAPGFAPGNPLHAMVLDDSALPGAGELSVRQRFERCVYYRQENAIRAVWSEGKKVYEA